jgi:hypothetical protein
MPSGTGAMPIPSPVCQVLVSPVGPGTVSFFTTANGDFSLTATLPAGLQAMDACLQMGVINGSNFVVSNPLQMHLR